MTKEAEAKKERKFSGEGKGLPPLDSVDNMVAAYYAGSSIPHTAKKSNRGVVVFALLVLGLLGIGGVVYKARRGFKSDV